VEQDDPAYRVLFESHPQPMWIYDLETLAFLAVNDAAIAHYGYTRDAFLAMTIKDIRPGEDVAALLENVAAVTEGLDRAGVWRHRRRDGTIIEVEIDSHTLLFHGRRCEVVRAADITERRRLEARLWNAQKLESVGRIAGGVAHDFNNLLTVILGYGEILRPHLESDPDAAAALGEIVRAGERARELTRHMLAFASRQPVAPRPLDLNEVLSGMRRMVERLLGADHALELRLDPAAWPVMGDPAQIEQVVMNLAVNARDAMDAGGRVVITTSNRDVDAAEAERLGLAGPGPHAVVSVRDTGTGLSAQDLAHLFEPFYSTKRPGLGTGLGLATVYGIVRQAGGHVTVDSVPGKGTEFQVWLPRTTATVTAVAAAAPRPAPRGGGTVLVVEDDAFVRPLVALTLESAGYRVLVAADGEEALRVAERHGGAIDLLVTDVVLPGLRGPEVARRLAGQRPGLPVLFVSGYSPEALERQGDGEPAANLLPKPFTPAALLERVHALLGARRG
jgi:hypothetical protein